MRSSLPDASSTRYAASRPEDSPAANKYFPDGSRSKERGVFSHVFLLGRLRASVAQERRTAPFDLSDYSLSSIERSVASAE